MYLHFYRVLLTQWISEIIEQVAIVNPPLLNNGLVVLVINNLLNIGESRNIPRLAIATRYSPFLFLNIWFFDERYEAVGVNQYKS